MSPLTLLFVAVILLRAAWAVADIYPFVAGALTASVAWLCLFVEFNGDEEDDDQDDNDSGYPDRTKAA